MLVVGLFLLALLAAAPGAQAEATWQGPVAIGDNFDGPTQMTTFGESAVAVTWKRRGQPVVAYRADGETALRPPVGLGEPGYDVSDPAAARLQDGDALLLFSKFDSDRSLIIGHRHSHRPDLHGARWAGSVTRSMRP